ncbi:glycosyltransferase [uncultured Aquimarina sp.]|uniref:glycosyltransferase n=1 Tax=uncultured Aquimarina sp. TaxID=575652 RepID=UPI00262DD036|nr:glycosyltransferase [uncultured Aquimarina sp.]
MNILLIMPYGSVGGMERLAFTFYNHYRSMGHKVKAVKLIKLESDIINFGQDEYHFSDIDFADMSKSNRALFYLKAPLRLRKIIKKEKISHSISFGDMTNVFSSLTYTKEFKIASIHALKSVELSAKNMLNRIFELSYRTTYRNFDKVVCISKAIKLDLQDNCGYTFNNLQVIYNPHNVSQIIELSKEKITDNKELQIFSEDTILFLGRMSIQKAPWHLINAFSKLSITKKTNLVFIGDGDDRVLDYLKKQINDLKISDSVFFLGRRKNPYKYISSSTLLSLSSYYEGTPNVIVESLCLKTPVVSSNCTDGILELMSIDQRDLIEHNNIMTEGGIVTPNLFKGDLSVPSEETLNYASEEASLSQGLQLGLENATSLRNAIENKYELLLSKFDLQNVTKQYLK